jgi:hypothetical protein
MLALLGIVAVQDPFYFVADAYYAARKMVNGLLAQNHHLVTRVKSNAVAYTPHLQQGPMRALTFPEVDFWEFGQDR